MSNKETEWLLESRWIRRISCTTYKHLLWLPLWVSLPFTKLQSSCVSFLNMISQLWFQTMALSIIMITKLHSGDLLAESTQILSFFLPHLTVWCHVVLQTSCCLLSPLSVYTISGICHILVSLCSSLLLCAAPTNFSLNMHARGTPCCYEPCFFFPSCLSSFLSPFYSCFLLSFGEDKRFVLHETFTTIPC